MKRALGAIALVLVAVGALHLPAARSLALALGGCPADSIAASDVEALRAHSQQALDELGPARGLPAAGFALGAWTVDDALAWAQAQGVVCGQKRRGDVVVACEQVPAHLVAAGGKVPIDRLTFVFGVDQRLLGVELVRRQLTRDDAGATVSLRAQALQEELGLPTDLVGDLSLAADPTARVRHLHRDYLATVTATRVPGSGFVVHEQFQRRPAQAPRASLH